MILVFNRVLFAGSLALFGIFGSTFIAHPEDLEPVPVLNNDSPSKISLSVPRSGIQPSEMGVVVNDSDPQSVAVAKYFQEKHAVPAQNIAHVRFRPASRSIPAGYFSILKSRVDSQLSANVQAYAITWTSPWVVGTGMSITSAFSLGYDPKYVSRAACSMTATVPYYDSASVRPFTDLKIRPAMMLAGATTQDALDLVDRGIAAAQILPAGDGYFIRTSDPARSVRYPNFQATVNSWNRPDRLKMTYSGGSSDYLENTSNILFYLTGLTTVPGIYSNRYVAGAVADHLTSTGGELLSNGQMSVLEWLKAGATASYGTVGEPCNFPAKFPAASVLVKNYFSGRTIVEAYWSSVQAPGEGIFVGDPLARPFGTRADVSKGVLSIKTSILQPGRTYTLQGSKSASGPFQDVESSISVADQSYKLISAAYADYAFYRLVSVSDTTGGGRNND
jgi:uncharacterized protein (TIGR03790 family)